jgi:transposase
MPSSPAAAETLVVSSEDRDTLTLWIRMPTAPQRLVLRSRIVLMLAEGHSAREVGRRLGVSRHTVDLWRARYLREGSDTLRRDRPGRGRKRAAAAVCAKRTSSISLRADGYLSAEGGIHRSTSTGSAYDTDRIDLARDATSRATRFEPRSRVTPLDGGPVILRRA